MEITGTLNPQIRKLLESVCLKNGWGTTDEDLAKILIDGDIIWSELGEYHHWYEDETVIVNIEDILIQYDWYHITGDNGAYNLGLEFDLSSVQLCEAYQVTITKYRPKQM